LETILDFLVPQAVNDGIEERNNNSIESRHDFVCVMNWKCFRPQIDENACCIEDNDHYKVGGTGGEGFLATVCR